MPTTERSPRGRLDATTAACLVFLDPQDGPERTAAQANLVCPDHLASLVALHWRSARSSHHPHAGHAHQDHPVPLAHLEMLATPDQTVNLEALARMVPTDHLAQPDPTAHLAPQARTERRDHRDPTLLAFQPPLEMLVNPEKLAHPAHLVKTALLAQMEAPAQLATRAHPDRLARPATTELLETRDHLAQMVQRENRVFAPNTAPPTVVSSSKTEQGDKRSHQPFRSCHIDEKPVINMSILVFIIFVLFQWPIPSTTIDHPQYCRCVPRH